MVDRALEALTGATVVVVAVVVLVDDRTSFSKSERFRLSTGANVPVVIAVLRIELLYCGSQFAAQQLNGLSVRRQRHIDASSPAGRIAAAAAVIGFRLLLAVLAV